MLRTAMANHTNALNALIKKLPMASSAKSALHATRRLRAENAINEATRLIRAASESCY